MEERNELINSNSLKFAVFIGACVILLFWFLQFLWKIRHMYRLSNDVPGPAGWPLIGVALQYLGSHEDIFRQLELLVTSYPRILAAWFGPFLYYGISDANYMEILLRRCLRKGLIYGHFESVVGHGLFTAPVEKWKPHRKHIMTMFKQKILDEFVEIFSKQSNELVEHLKEFDGKGEFDLFRLISNFSLDSVCENILGIKVNALSSNSPYSQWLEKITSILVKRISRLWYYSDIIFKMSTDSKIFQDCINKTLEFTDKVIFERKQAYEKRKQFLNAEYHESERKKKVLLDYLIEIADKENGSFTTEEVRNEVTTLIVASSDTSATAVCFTLTMLGLYPDIQTKVYNEIMEVVGENREIEYSDLPHMKYMEMVILETLRLFPPAPIIGRAIDEDVDLGDFSVSKGATALFAIKTVQIDEKFWPNPFKFIPERFLPEEIAKRSPCAFIPFSYGPRNCIGARYAMMSTKTVLAKILMKYKLSTSYKNVEDIKVYGEIMLRPVEGYKLSIESR